jgi:hypothetical protein
MATAQTTRVQGITIEKKNNSFFKHATCTIDDGLLHQNMWCDLQYREEEEA